MDVSIIILTKNAGDSFRQLLDRVYSQKSDSQFEVLVVDSGSKDNTLKIAKDFPVTITEIKSSEFHHGRTRNLGAELAQGSILVYITQDALPLKNDWLQKLTHSLKGKGVAMVCGRQIPWETVKPPEKFFYVYNFPPFRIEVNSGASDYYHDNVFISNVNSAIRREVWKQLRFSNKVLMAEDKEFAKRALLDGWSIIYEPEAAVYHAHDFTIREVFRRYVDYGISARQGYSGLPRSRGWLIKKLLCYSIEETKYLKATGNLKWLPFCLIYDMSRYLGTIVGQARSLVRTEKNEELAL